MDAISKRLRTYERGEEWGDFVEKMLDAADTIDALVDALREATPYVPEHHAPTRHKISAAIKKATGA